MSGKSFLFLPRESRYLLEMVDDIWLYNSIEYVQYSIP